MTAEAGVNGKDKAAARGAGLKFFGIFPFPLCLGLVLFAASMAPSLIPRGWVLQGILAGLVMAIGYLIGRFGVSLWNALQIPPLARRWSVSLAGLASISSVGLLVWSLAMSANWQNSIRQRVDMEVVDGFHTGAIVFVALSVFLCLFLLGLGVQWVYDLLRSRLYRLIPRHSANTAGFILVVALLFILTRDGLVARTMDFLDSSYETAQELFATAPMPPEDGSLPGGPGSFVDWGAMGQPGRDFVLAGPDAAAITAFTERPAKDPIRVYVGRAQADDPEGRAVAALEELIRLGGFERGAIVVASPTGTGWLDPGGHDPMEFMLDGDVATVAVQYSYLQSPLALVFETNAGLDQATATMRAVYDHWRSLPSDSRPEFYMHGISLGAWSSMYSFDIFAMVNDPINGAFWAGPPFPSDLWQRAIRARNPGTPYVLPEVGTGKLVRFLSQYKGADRAVADWGILRVAFLQYASDPIVFYEPASLWRAPEWMREPPAADVSPDLIFVPVVTQLQLALDMALSTALPQGYGHNYVAEHYIDGWVEILQPTPWTGADTVRLKEICSLDWGLGCKN
ncbi:MAG: alpha/beta-hydrolase family protein [Pseudomonadota bacterium]